MNFIRLFLCASLLPFGVVATPLNTMSSGQLDQLLQQAQQMQACLQKAQPGLMEKLQAQAGSVTHEIRTLCQSGNRRAAQQQALDFTKTVTGNQEIKVMEECANLGDQIMATVSGHLNPEGGTTHVCDTLQ